MQLVLNVQSKEFARLKDIFLKDDTVGRASLTFKEAKMYGGKEGYYIYVSGLEEACKKALEISKDLAKEVTGKEKEQFLKKLKEEEDRAAEGMGGIFG